MDGKKARLSFEKGGVGDTEVQGRRPPGHCDVNGVDENAWLDAMDSLGPPTQFKLAGISFSLSQVLLPGYLISHEW